MADHLRSLERQIVVRARKKVALNIASVLYSVSSSSAMKMKTAGFARKHTLSASMLLCNLKALGAPISIIHLQSINSRVITSTQAETELHFTRCSEITSVTVEAHDRCQVFGT
jgi:hypothetical protein